jgi:hypothetical protein
MNVLSHTCPARLAVAVILSAALLAVIPAVGNAAAGAETVTVTMKGQRFTFMKQDLTRDYTGAVTLGTLAKPAAVAAGGNRIAFAGGSGITFYESGAVAGGYLAGDQVLRTGKYRLRFRRGYPVQLHESGALLSGYLAGDQSLQVGSQRITLKRVHEEPDFVEFYPSGRLARGTLTRRQRLTIGGRALDLAGQIGFYESGGIEWGHLAADTTIPVGKNSLLLTGSEYHNVEFSPTGRVLRGCLASSQRVTAGDLPLFLECNIEFDEGGKILKGVLSQDLQYRGVQFHQFQTVTFSYDRGGALAAIGVYHLPER